MESLKLIVDYGIIGFLLLMSIIAVGIAIERYFFIRKFDLKSFLEENKTAGELEVLLTKRMYVISSVGVNAPYIGLLGTVIGIMLTFYDISHGSMNIKSVMIGLSLALKATAIGILVAIPCVFLNNLLLRKAREKIEIFKSLEREKYGC